LLAVLCCGPFGATAWGAGEISDGRSAAARELAGAVRTYEKRFKCKVFFSVDFDKGRVTPVNRPPPKGKKIEPWIEYLSDFLPLSKPLRVEGLNDLILTRRAKMVDGMRMRSDGLGVHWPWFVIRVRLPLLRWHELRPWSTGARESVVAAEHVFSCQVGDSIAHCTRRMYYRYLRRDYWIGLKQGSRWGFADRTGRWKILPRFDAVRPFSEKRAAARKDGRWGFVDKKGNWKVAVSYDEARDFHQGRAAVRQGERWSFVDRDGKVLADMKFNDAGDFHDERAVVRRGDKWGYIDRDGRIRIPLKFARADGFSEGLAGALLDGRWGYLDTKGNWAVWPRFTWGTPYHNGRAWVNKDGAWGWIDPEGLFIYMPPSVPVPDDNKE